MLASRRNGTLYVGSAVDLSRRIWEHKNKLTPGFTSDYDVTMLGWYEAYDRVIDGRHRVALIEAMNPQWRDLYDELNS